MNVITLGIVIGIVLGIGGGGFYLLWLKTRPKKETWFARVYQLTESVKEPVIINGKVISEIKLKDMKPYAKDIIEKVEKEPGITVYRLQKLNKPVPAIEGDVVEYWGKDNKEVSVLLNKGNYSLMGKGYDLKTGEAVFKPMPISRINMMKSEIAIRKDRLHKEKDILQAITPWIVAGICMLALIGMCYILGAAFVEMSENFEESVKHMDDTMLKLKGIDPNAKVDPSLGQQANVGTAVTNSNNIPVIDQI